MVSPLAFPLYRHVDGEASPPTAWNNPNEAWRPHGHSPRLCRSLAHGGQKLVLGTSLPEFSPSNGPLLEAKFSHRGHDNANLGQKSIFPRFRAYQSFGDQMLTGWEAYEPRPAPLDNDEPEEKPRAHGHTISGYDKKFWPPL